MFAFWKWEKKETNAIKEYLSGRHQEEGEQRMKTIPEDSFLLKRKAWKWTQEGKINEAVAYKIF